MISFEQIEGRLQGGGSQDWGSGQQGTQPKRMSHSKRQGFVGLHVDLLSRRIVFYPTLVWWCGGPRFPSQRPYTIWLQKELGSTRNPRLQTPSRKGCKPILGFVCPAKLGPSSAASAWLRQCQRCSCKLLASKTRNSIATP